jgi:hypothetical protein
MGLVPTLIDVRTVLVTVRIGTTVPEPKTVT